MRVLALVMERIRGRSWGMFSGDVGMGWALRDAERRGLPSLHRIASKS